MPTVTVTNSFVVYAGETLTFTNENAFSLQQQSGGPAEVLTIRGTVDVTRNSSVSSSSIYGVYVNYNNANTANSAVMIESGGVLKVTSTLADYYYYQAYGFYGDYTSPDFINQGVVQVAAVGGATGVYAYGSNNWDFNNSGQMTVTSTGGSARGLTLGSSGGRVVNSGTLQVTGKSDVTAVTMSSGYGGTSFTNSGTIKAIDASTTFDSIGVSWTTSGYSATFINNGWIEGDYALKVTGYSYATSTDVFTNNGTLLGKVDMGTGATRLVNGGVIWGDASMAGGADIYDGANGTFFGRMSGGDGNDTLTGGAGGEFFQGDAGNDVLTGGGGADTLQGGLDADTISGGAGDDIISGGRDADLLDGGAGFDVLDYADATMGVTASFATGRAFASGEDTISGFEKIIGGIYGDTLTGSAGADNLMAGGGDDSLQGGDGQDYLRGEAGADYIVGGGAFDDIHGNQGDDTASGGDGDDWVVGGQDNDRLTGDLGDDIVYGNLGNDVLDGGAGNDIVRGGQGDDVLAGGDGGDWLSGDRGDDNITGGAGADIFHSFADAGVDLVTDFNFAEGDRVQLDGGTQYTLSQVGANTVVTMSGGQLVLAGVQLSSLPAGWIFGA